LLNYTYGTNLGISKSSVLINIIDTNEIRDDILLAKSYNPDGIIIFFTGARNITDYLMLHRQRLLIFVLGMELII